MIEKHHGYRDENTFGNFLGKSWCHLIYLESFFQKKDQCSPLYSQELTKRSFFTYNVSTCDNLKPQASTGGNIFPFDDLIDQRLWAQKYVPDNSIAI
jgi:hypothetical protein